MRKPLLVDGHVHTLACGHAYSTITELAHAAKEKGLEAICWTEHGPKMYGGVNNVFFNNIQVVPPEIDGVRVLRGIEANILDFDGNIDVRPRFKDKLEIIGASLHKGVIKPGTIEENTNAILGAIDNEDVDFICHLGNPDFPIDYERVVKAAAEKNKMIEINNSSFFVRKGSRDNCIKIAELCKEYNVPIIVGTDSHFSDSVGNFDCAIKALDIAEVPDELIINNNPEKLYEFLENKGKTLGRKRMDDGEDVFADLEEVEDV